MNAVIVYAGMTGHSKKLANFLAERFALPVIPATEEPPEYADLLILIGGIYADSPHRHMVSFARKLTAQQCGAAAVITSSASKKTGQQSVIACLKEKGIPCLGECHVKGSFAFAVSRGHPDQADRQEAADFAAELLKTAQA